MEHVQCSGLNKGPASFGPSTSQVVEVLGFVVGVVHFCDSNSNYLVKPLSCDEAYEADKGSVAPEAGSSIVSANRQMVNRWPIGDDRCSAIGMSYKDAGDHTLADVVRLIVVIFNR